MFIGRRCRREYLVYENKKGRVISYSANARMRDLKGPEMNLFKLKED
jgi:hypothetical protein